jgi:hypothetical protein
LLVGKLVLVVAIHPLGVSGACASGGVASSMVVAVARAEGSGVGGGGGAGGGGGEHEREI